MVLEWLTWAPHWDGGLELVTRDHRRYVFHKMQLTTSRVNEESRAGMMIAGACKPPTSGKGPEASGQGSRTASLGQAVPLSLADMAHPHQGPRSGGGMVQGEDMLGGKD